MMMSDIRHVDMLSYKSRGQYTGRRVRGKDREGEVGG